MMIIQHEVVTAQKQSTAQALGVLQLKCDACKKKKAKGLLQRAAERDYILMDGPYIVHDVLRSPGQPLDLKTREFMEPRFRHSFSRTSTYDLQASTSMLKIGQANNHHEREADRVADQIMRPAEFATSDNVKSILKLDFSQVRVHSDDKASESARAVNALAYTAGQDIVFGAGQYSPGTAAGKQLLAHELTHVAQSSDKMPNSIQRLTKEEKEQDLKSERLKYNGRLQRAFDNDPSMRIGEIGDGVKTLQRALRDLGYYMPISFRKTGDADGIFGDETRSTVRQFQSDYELDADGVAGRQTLGKLDELYSVDHQLPPCPVDIQFEENASRGISAPGMSCQMPQTTPPSGIKDKVDMHNSDRKCTLTMAISELKSLAQAIDSGLNGSWIDQVFAMQLGSMNTWLKANRSDPDFRNTLTQAMGLLSDNLMASVPVGFPPKSDITCIIPPCKPQGYGCSRGSVEVNVCRGWVAKGFNCRTGVILHEFNHFIGLHKEAQDRASIKKPADAFDNADSMAQCVLELNNRPTDCCGKTC
jgi:hypothetical protein